jgi:hypothetical protein
MIASNRLQRGFSCNYVMRVLVSVFEVVTMNI